MFHLLRSRSLLLPALRPTLNRSLTSARLPPINYKSADDTTSSAALEGRKDFLLDPQGRPMSPHLTIYEPQLTWLMSIGHRVTGAGLSGLIYAFGIYYGLASPENVTSEMASWIVQDCPAALVYAGKYVLAAPFIFHTLNGIRHLVSRML